MRKRGVVVAALLAAMVPAGVADASRLERFKIPSRFVNGADPNVPFNNVDAGLPSPRTLPVNVLLPDGYDGKRRFPVLYLLHGHGDHYNSWVQQRNGDARRLLKGFGAIVVMPEGGRGWYANWWNGGRRGAPAWERYHLDELVPAVKKRYRVRRGRRWHALAGLSMGAEGAIFYASQRPGYFGAAASFSGPLSIQREEWPTGMDTQGEDHQDVFGDPSEQEFYWAGHNPKALVHNLEHTRVYVASGDGTFTRPDEVDNTFGAVAEAELRRHQADFVRAAEVAHVPVTAEEHAGIHDWPYWRRDLVNAVRWGFFKPAVVRPPAWEFSTASQVSQAWGFRFRFAKPPTTLITFRRQGSRIAATGAGTVTLRAPGGGKFTAKLPFNRDIPKKTRR